MKVAMVCVEMGPALTITVEVPAVALQEICILAGYATQGNI
jgi:hypothetical protein